MPAASPTRRQLLHFAIASPLVELARASGEDTPKVKRVYIAADDHTDYMWTADEETYRKAFLETIDHYLDLADQTDDRDSALQSRWNCDGLMWFYEYVQNRDAAHVERLVRRIKSGHISVPKTILVSCYGGTPTEAVIRGLYYGGHVERHYNVDLCMAVAMENQTLPYGLGMLWAGSGIKYSWRGICGCSSKIPHSASEREHDVYWWVGPDGSRILMKWYSLSQPVRRGAYWNEGPGGYAEARHPEDALKFIEVDKKFLRKNPHKVIGLFGQGWDDLKTIVPLEDATKSLPAVAQRMTSAKRRVIVSNEVDYFKDMESTYGDKLPEVSCSFGNEWDLYSASMAEVSASVKRATEKLRAAEAMAAMIAQRRPNFADDLDEQKQQAWIAFGLYWEHDWTADGPVSREKRSTWQRKIAKQIHDYVDTLYERSKTALGELIHNQTDGEHVFVFNPLGWQRTDYAETPLHGDGDFVAIDIKADHAVPSQIITRDEKRWLRFLVSDMPACGYRVYEIRSGMKYDGNSTIKTNSDEITSARQRVKVAANGSIRFWESFTDNKIVIREGQTGNDLEPARGQIAVESSGSVCTTVRIDVARPIARTTRVTLFEDMDRIEVENSIRENFDSVEKWKYEFNLDAPKTIHEEVGAILTAATLKEGGDYADRNSRTDWLTLNHFVTMEDDSAAVTLANRDCLFFHLGSDVKEPMDSRSNVVHALAGGQVDGPKLGIQKQGGDRRFEQNFALFCSKPGKPQSESMRQAMEFTNPLVVGQVQHDNVDSNLPAYPPLKIDSENVISWALKPAESGNGWIVRLWNLSNTSSRYKLTMTTPIKTCHETTHVETDIQPIELVDGEVSRVMAAGAMQTLRVRWSDD